MFDSKKWPCRGALLLTEYDGDRFGGAGWSFVAQEVLARQQCGTVGCVILLSGLAICHAGC